MQYLIGVDSKGVSILIKEETPVTLVNGGMHNQKAYRKMKAMLNNNTYKQPRLYHLIMMGSEQAEPYQAALKALCFELRRKGMDCQWKACVEVEPDKGLHMHVFLLVEAKHYNPCSILNHSYQGWLLTMMEKRGLIYHLSPPKGVMHRTGLGKRLNYATLAGEKLADCLIWISYLVKRRSKVDSIKQIYFGSRPSRTKVAVV